MATRHTGTDIHAHGHILPTSLNYMRLIFCLLCPFHIPFRTNLAFASIQLNADMKWPPSVYGFGSGLFFLVRHDFISSAWCVFVSRLFPCLRLCVTGPSLLTLATPLLLSPATI